MVDADRVAQWIGAYRRAWESNDPAEIGALFTDDAEYFTAPFRPPWRGREEIVEGWLERKDTPGETTFTWSLTAVDGDLAVVRGETAYPDEVYSNLWLIRLDNKGRCAYFTEWWMLHDSGE